MIKRKGKKQKSIKKLINYISLFFEYSYITLLAISPIIVGCLAIEKFEPSFTTGCFALLILFAYVGMVILGYKFLWRIDRLEKLDKKLKKEKKK